MYYGVETIKRQTRVAYCCLVACSKSRGRGLSLLPIGCMLAVSVTCGAAAAAIAALPFNVSRLWSLLSSRCW